MTISTNDSTPKPRYAVIMGCGRLGASVASQLCAEGWTLTILDTNSDTFNRLSADLIDHKIIVPMVGDGMSEHTLRRASTQDADIFIAVSGRDTRNVLAAQIAKHILEVPTVVCRMNDPTRKLMYEELGIVTISPTNLVTDLVVDATRGL